MGSFRCPGCGENLEEDTRWLWPITLLSLSLGVTVAYFVGLNGMMFFLAAFFLAFIVICIAAFVVTYLRPRLVRRADGLDFRITGPPDPHGKNGGG